MKCIAAFCSVFSQLQNCQPFLDRGGEIVLFPFLHALLSCFQRIKFFQRGTENWLPSYIGFKMIIFHIFQKGRKHAAIINLEELIVIIFSIIHSSSSNCKQNIYIRKPSDLGLDIISDKNEAETLLSFPNTDLKFTILNKTIKTILFKIYTWL